MLISMDSRFRGNDNKHVVPQDGDRTRIVAFTKGVGRLWLILAHLLISTYTLITACWTG